MHISEYVQIYIIKACYANFSIFTNIHSYSLKKHIAIYIIKIRNGLKQILQAVSYFTF